MLSDEIIEKVIERLVRRIEQTNIYLLQQIGESIKRVGALTPSKAQELIQIMRYGGDYDKIVKALAKMTKLNVKDIYAIFEEVAKNDYMFAEQFYNFRNKKFIPYDDNEVLKTQVRALANQTAQTFVNLTRTMAFARVKDGKVIYSPIAEVYHDILDKAVLSMAQGKTTFDKQLHQSIKELASNGIKVVNYESGRTLRLDSAVRMQMKDALRTLHNETQQIFGEEFNSDGVEISVHLNPADDHADVQGKQFSNDEFKKFQNDEEATSYDGEVFPPDYENHDRRSIGQYNCYHYVFAIVLGVSKPQYTKKELQFLKQKNQEGFMFEGKHYTNYQGTQLQRHLELEIRKQKDIQIIAKASGDSELIRESQSKISQLTKKYKRLSDVSGLPTKVQRMRVSGYKRTKA